jgi:hypothetical protein
MILICATWNRVKEVNNKMEIEELSEQVEKLAKRVQYLEDRQISRLRYLQLKDHKDEEFNEKAQKIIDQIEARRR